MEIRFQYCQAGIDFGKLGKNRGQTANFAPTLALISRAGDFCRQVRISCVQAKERSAISNHTSNQLPFVQYLSSGTLCFDCATLLALRFQPMFS
jgi:hypothetical protein